MKRISDRENARRLVAYRECQTDAAASLALGLKGATFRLWRKANGLPAKQTGKPRGRHGARPAVKLPASAVASVEKLLANQKLEQIRQTLR
jgi:hypothetical protein